MEGMPTVSARPLPPLPGGAGSCAAPEFSNTRTQDCALGGNPHYAGDEFLAARFADFRLYDRALSAEEISTRHCRNSTMFGLR